MCVQYHCLCVSVCLSVCLPSYCFRVPCSLLKFFLSHNVFALSLSQEEEKNELVLQSAENRRLLKRIEGLPCMRLFQYCVCESSDSMEFLFFRNPDRILELLSTEGDLLENAEVIEALDESKAKSNEIEIKQRQAEKVSVRFLWYGIGGGRGDQVHVNSQH